MPISLVDRPGTFRPMLWLTLPVLVEQMLMLAMVCVVAIGSF